MQDMLPECGCCQKKHTGEVTITMENRRKKQSKEERVDVF